MNEAPLMLPYREVPVIINSFNRYSHLKKLVDWLRSSGYRNLVVVDNSSSFGPLVRYLEHLGKLDGVRVLRLRENLGHTALWDAELLRRLHIESEYVYTDPDVVPARTCPPDVVRVLQELLRAEPAVFKAGLGLRLDDIPRFYRHRRAVLAWETKYWLRPAAPGLFVAPIDTTFALYRPMSDRGVDELAIRTGPPYVAAHESWYSTGLLLRHEDRHYARSAAPNSASTWSRVHLPEWLRRWEHSLDELYPLVLLVDEPGAALPGYVHCERLLRRGRGTLELEDGSVDGFYLPKGTSPLHEAEIDFEELRRVAKPGAPLVVRAQVCQNDSARRSVVAGASELDAWVAGLPGQALDGVLPERHGSWMLERLQLVFDPAAVPSALGGPLLSVASARREALTEQIVHLRAWDPSRDIGVAGRDGAQIDVTVSRLDLHSGFELLAPVPPPA